jgi:hypothetical protein
MQRVLTLIGAFVGAVVISMLWFWLLFGGWRVVCGDTVQPLFMAGSTQFAVIAGLWGLIVVGLIVSPAGHPLYFVLWAVALGSLYETLHHSSWRWMAGVDLALTALLAILFMQGLTLAYLYHTGLKPGQSYRAFIRWATLAVPGLLGVTLTDLWITTIPCVPGVNYSSPLAGIAFSSTIWYVIFGLLPALVTAIIYAGETQPARR